MPPTERASQERQELIAAAHNLTQKVDRLDRNLTINQRQLSRVRRVILAQAVIVAFTVAIVVVMVVLVIQVDRTSHTTKNLVNHNQQLSRCIAQWEAQYTSRVNILTRLSSKRSNILNTLVETITNPANAGERAVVKKAVNDYRMADAAYNRASKDNPVPPAPTFNCK